MNRLTAKHLRRIIVLLFYLALLTTAETAETVEPQYIGSDERPQSSEMRLKSRLLHNYDTTSRPVMYDNDTVHVNVGISLFHLMRVNEKEQTIQATYSFRFSWIDQYLTWNASRYGVRTIFLPVSRIWRPDIMILNTAMGELFEFMDTNAIVSSNGAVMWMVPFTPVTTCSINVLYYPFDIQSCNLTFISWTYSGKQLNLTKHPDSATAIYYSATNQEWKVMDIEAVQNNKIYACCPNDPYPDVTFILHMKRRSLFYIINLIIPSLLIYALAIIGFYLPSSQRVDMETTVWLTLVVFLSGVNETMPPTPDAVSVLSLYFLLILCLVALAIVASVIITYLSDRPRFSPIPKWGDKLIRFVFRKSYNHPSIQSVMRQRRRRRQHKRSVLQEDCASVSSDKSEMNGGMTTNGVGVHLTANRSYDSDGGLHYIDQAESFNLNEWKLFAEALDILFFYIFLILCVGMLVLFGALTLPVIVRSLKHEV